MRTTCGYTVVGPHGFEEPCGSDGVSWRWYSGAEHEDCLDVACLRHDNTGGMLLAWLRAEVAWLREQLDSEIGPAPVSAHHARGDQHRGV